MAELFVLGAAQFQMPLEAAPLLQAAGIALYTTVRFHGTFFVSKIFCKTDSRH